MSEDATWDDYTTDTSAIGTDAPLADQIGELQSQTDDLDAAANLDPSTPEADGLAIDSADTSVGDAGDAQSWADWNSATGDEASTSAESYFDDAQKNADAGYTDLAAQEVTDGNSQLDYASDQYSAAADNESDAASDLDSASQSLGSVDDSTSTDDSTWSAASTDDTSTDDSTWSAAATDDTATDDTAWSAAATDDTASSDDSY